jgi:hypothetical protein
VNSRAMQLLEEPGCQPELSNRQGDIVLVSTNKFGAKYGTISIRVQTLFASGGVTPLCCPAENVNTIPRVLVVQPASLWLVNRMLKAKAFLF